MVSEQDRGPHRNDATAAVNAPLSGVSTCPGPGHTSSESTVFPVAAESS